VLLGNDVVVTEGWLDQLIGLADCRERRVGLVGPMMNHGASPQSVGAVPYHDLPSMHEFAQRWRDGHRGKWFTVAQLSGKQLVSEHFSVVEKCSDTNYRQNSETTETRPQEEAAGLDMVAPGSGPGISE
jgi:hypothetical protein